MKASTLEGAAFGLILGLGACADGLAELPGGIAVLMGGVGLSGLLVHLAHSRDWDREREHTEVQEGPRSAPAGPAPSPEKRLTEGKKKAAAVVATPQRQVKQTRKISISRPYFTGAKGDCQIEF